MPRIVVHVMPKPEILDPQGKAIAAALPRLGFAGFASVRQGKRFELNYDGDASPEMLAQAQEAATTLLSNPVIEDVVSVAFVEDEAPAESGSLVDSGTETGSEPGPDSSSGSGTGSEGTQA